MKPIVQELSKFIGLRIYEDPTKASPYSARTMVNMILSDRGGLRKRQGVALLGAYNASAERCRGFDVFRKTDLVTEIPIKFYDDELEYYSATYGGWSRLKNGFTVGSDFGFCHGFVRSGNFDYIYGGNRYEDDFRWNGNLAFLSASLVGAETSVVVDTVLRSDIYYSGTASASSATTLDISPAAWASSQWINFYVLIKSGTHINKIRKITANTTTQITFDTLGSDPGSCSFEIRYSNFPASGTIIYNGTTIAYTAIPEYNKLSVGAAHAGTSGQPVTLVPDTYPANPRGNRMEVLRSRRYVANVRSALLRDASGVLSGAANPGSVFVSKVANFNSPNNDLIDFTFSATRAAGEGDIIAGAYGGEGHRDIKVHDDAVYMFKPNSIESVKYSQDTNDIPTLDQISTNYGSIMQVIEARDDVFFVTSDKQFTSLSRVKLKDQKETQLNIGLPVKRLLESYGYDTTARGAQFKNRVHIPAKSAETDDVTNRLLIYNLNGFFEGEWWLSVDKMAIYNKELCASQSNGANVLRLYQGLNDKLGKTGDDGYEYPITSQYASNWFNLTKSGFNQQEVSLFLCEGRILGNTKLTFKLMKNLNDNPFLQFDYEGSEDTVDSTVVGRFLGSFPNGIEPIGAISNLVDEEGMRHFMFMVYFPFEHAEWLSWGFSNSGKNQDYEILRAGFEIREDTILNFANRLKELT